MKRESMYDSTFEHDACGIGTVINIDGKKEHQLIDDALTMLENMEHRGGTGSDPETGDGAGILIQIDKEFIQEIYLQIPSRFKEIQSKNHSLQNQKVVLGKLCNCENAGFERINQGKLQLVNLKDHISLHLEIESNRNQVVKTIDIDI